MITVGGVQKTIDSELFRVTLFGENGVKVFIEVLGIERISTPMNAVNFEELAKLFPSHPGKFNRPAGKEIDLLIGMQYAGYHPVRRQAVGHLLLLENQFGLIIAGSHPKVMEKTQILVKHAVVLHALGSIERFFEIESLGTNCNPKCGSCICGTCQPGGKNMSIQEEEELRQIEENISFNKEVGRWTAKYPWIKDPKLLADNRIVAMATLRSTENRLMRNPENAYLYKRQIEDMVKRGAARILKSEELKLYKDPIFYLSHHAVLNPSSKFTPCRIVFNSSAKFKGYSLNDCLAKGPSMLNDILGILLRFREKEVAFVGDISKMFHSIDIPLEDQMTHLFLWRNLDQSKEVKTYAMTNLNMGDRPSSAIAQTALQKTAMESMNVYPEACTTILRNSYMDDIPGSVENHEKAFKVMKQIELLLEPKGFKIKEWLWSYMDSSENRTRTTSDQMAVQMLLCRKEMDTDTEKVLGMHWSISNDKLTYKFEKAEPSKKEQSIVTKRQILSIVSTIYDPLGLLAPITVKAKIILRKLWASTVRVGWDEPIPCEIEKEWNLLHSELQKVGQVQIDRSLTPSNYRVSQKK